MVPLLALGGSLVSLGQREEAKRSVVNVVIEGYHLQRVALSRLRD